MGEHRPVDAQADCRRPRLPGAAALHPPVLPVDSLPLCLQSDVWVCESKYPLVWLGLLVVPKLVQLAYGVYIAFKASKPISRC